MKKLDNSMLETMKGGGCAKWLRRLNRADNGDKASAMLEAYYECISVVIVKRY